MKFIVILAGKIGEIEIVVLDAEDALDAAWLATGGRNMEAIAFTPNEARELSEALAKALKNFSEMPSSC